MEESFVQYIEEKMNELKGKISEQEISSLKKECFSLRSDEPIRLLSLTQI